jgi:predicted transposase/invertase (TIGR01784 family)
MSQPPPTRDALHHEAFSELRVARSLFAHHLPAELARACDWSTLANETPVYKQCFEADAFCDLLFSVRLRRKASAKPSGGQPPLFLNLLFEHQSRPDPLMPYRLLRYMVRIWERYLADSPAARRLPAIYPLVLHQSHRPWRAPTRMRELFSLPESVQADVADRLPDFSFHLLDLATLPFDSLREAIIANGLLAVMKAIEAPDAIAVLDPVLEILGQALAEENDSALLSRFLGYLFHYSRNLDNDRFRQKISILTQPAMKTAGLSLAEQFIAEGEQKGRQEGRQEGRQRALASTLQRQLVRRFGPLPQAVRSRLQDAPVDELERLLDEVLDAPSLEALFPDA